MESFKSALLLLVWLPFFALNLVFAGVFIPVNKQFCAVRGPDGGVAVESGWTLSILSPLTAINTPTCVRNTVSREILGWTGIWPLGTAEEQVREQLRKSRAAPPASSS
jgi:hypothetical protein